MATIVGGIGTTHVPSIGKAIAEKKQNDPYWRPFFKGFDYVHYWLARTKPDVAVVFYNDHGLNFFLDKLPTFAVGASAEYRSEDEGWGIPVSRPVPGDADMSWHLINTLVADEFDVTMCQDMLIDHAVTIPMALMWPSAASSDRPWPVKIVPVEINTVQHPLPSMARCLKLGRSIGRALETYPRDLRVAIVGTGGLSHQLDGTRAGFVNKEFDALCLDKIVAEPEAQRSAVRRNRTIGPVVASDRRRKHRHFDDALPHRTVVELNGHAIGRIERALVPSRHPDVTRIVDPGTRRNAGFVYKVQFPIGLRQIGERRRRGEAQPHTLELTREIKDLRGCAGQTRRQDSRGANKRHRPRSHRPASLKMNV